ncbi:MAG TPA: CoA transferase, partial [Gammaproteobacteria bacterium]|nr:CoA transferase [Gammaproteobacteria bacterium]
LDLLEDPRFTTMADRTRNIDDTYAETAKTMAGRTTQEWLEVFEKTSVPINRVNTLEDLAEDPHLQAVDFWQFIEHPTEGRLRSTAFPARFSATPAEIRRHAPQLGEHSAEVLHELGYSAQKIEALVRSGATLLAD